MATSRWMWVAVAGVLSVGCGDGDDTDEVTAATIEDVTADEAGADYEMVIASVSLSGATAQAVESDAALTLLGEEVGGGKARDCTDESLDGTSLVIDYSACPHSTGTVTIERVRVGEWTITFDGDFSFFNVDIDGTVLVTRSGRGEFDVMTAGSDGSNPGTTPLLLTWTGRTGTYEREVVLTGADLTVTDGFDGFQLTGVGTLEGRSGRDPFGLGLGGSVAGEKDSPLLYPRPTEDRCATGGALHLEGVFTTPLHMTARFQVRDRTYDLLVDAELDLVADVGITLEDGVIDAVGIVPTSPVIIPDEFIERALERSTLPANIQQAIRDGLPEGVSPFVPLTPVQDAVSNVVSTLAADAAFCPAEI